MNDLLFHTVMIVFGASATYFVLMTIGGKVIGAGFYPDYNVPQVQTDEMRRTRRTFEAVIALATVLLLVASYTAARNASAEAWSVDFKPWFEGSGIALLAVIGLCRDRIRPRSVQIST